MEKKDFEKVFKLLGGTIEDLNPIEMEELECFDFSDDVYFSITNVSDFYTYSDILEEELDKREKENDNKYIASVYDKVNRCKTLLSENVSLEEAIKILKERATEEMEKATYNYLEILENYFAFMA